MNLSVARLDQSRRELIFPSSFARHQRTLRVPSLLPRTHSLTSITQQDRTNTSTFPISYAERSDSRYSSRTKVDGVSSGVGESRRLLVPVDRLGEDLVEEGSEEFGVGFERSKIGSVVRVVDGESEIGRRPVRLVGGGKSSDSSSSASGEKLRMIRNSNRQESHREDWQSLRMRNLSIQWVSYEYRNEGKERTDLGLILSIFSSTFSQSIRQSNEILGETGDDEGLATIVKTDADAGLSTLLLDEPVDLGNLLLQRRQFESSDGEHRRRRTFSILDRRGDEAGREGERGESDGALETDLEENRQSMQRMLVESFPRISRRRSLRSVLDGDDGGGDDSLRMTRRSLELFSKLFRAQTRSFTEYHVLRKLGETDEREGDGAGGEVGDGRSCGGRLEPGVRGEGVVVELRRVFGGGEGGEMR